MLFVAKHFCSTWLFCLSLDICWSLLCIPLHFLYLTEVTFCNFWTSEHHPECPLVEWSFFCFLVLCQGDPDLNPICWLSYQVLVVFWQLPISTVSTLFLWITAHLLSSFTYLFEGNYFKLSSFRICFLLPRPYEVSILSSDKVPGKYFEIDIFSTRSA